MGAWSRADRLDRLAFFGLVGAGIWLLAFSASRSLELSLLLALLVGSLMTVGSAAMQTIIQLRSLMQQEQREQVSAGAAS
jgi:hypothetical protein